MPTHRLVNGETLEYEASEELLAFMKRAEARADDPEVTPNDMIDLLYGEENPLLIRGVIPGRGYVTREIMDNPAYRVVMDLHDRVRIRTGQLDLEAAAAACTVSVSEAAKRLGISTGAVRQAIASRRLAAMKRDGQHWMRPESVASYKLTRKGPAPSTGRAPALSVRCGTEGPVALELRHDGEWNEIAAYGGGEVDIHLGEVTGWTWAAIRTKEGDATRLLRLRPGNPEEEVRVEDLYVRGRFEVVEDVNQARSVEVAWGALPETTTTS